MVIKKNTIFVLLIIVCMEGFASAKEVLHDGERIQARHWTSVSTPRPQFSWWRPPPWWRRPPSHSPPNHHHKSPSQPVHRRSPRNRHHKNPVTPPPPPPPPTAPSDDGNQPPPKRDPGDCSTALIYIDGCLRDLITSFFQENVSVGPVCCQAISGLSDNCFKEAFTQFESPNFTRSIRAFCALQR